MEVAITNTKLKVFKHWRIVHYIQSIKYVGSTLETKKVRMKWKDGSLMVSLFWQESEHQRRDPSKGL